MIIILSHCGLDRDIRIAKEVKGIDLIIGGHTHTLLSRPMKIKNNNSETVLISQNGEFGTVVGRWDITVKNDRIFKYKFNI